MIEVIQLEQPPTFNTCVIRDTAEFSLNIEAQVMYFTVVTCDGKMMYWAAPVQAIVDNAVERERLKNVKKDEET